MFIKLFYRNWVKTLRRKGVTSPKSLDKQKVSSEKAVNFNCIFKILAAGRTKTTPAYKNNHK